MLTTPRVTIQQRFVRSTRSGRAESPTFADGLKNMSVLEACRRSSAKGSTIPVRAAHE